MLRERCESSGPGGPIGPQAASRLLTDATFSIGSVAAPGLQPAVPRQDTRLLAVRFPCPATPAALVGSGSTRARFAQHAGWLSPSWACSRRAAFHVGFSDEKAHRIEAGADLFLMPSRFEPCGLNQMYSQRYGTPPIVHRTGGLADTVEAWNPRTGAGTGFVFEHFTATGLAWALAQALRCFADSAAFARVRANGMAKDFSWQRQITRYEALYARLLAR
jgi:starch synthase